MRFRLPAFIVVLLGVVQLAAAEPPKGQRVFTAGHSFHMGMPSLLKEMAESAKISGHEIAGLQSIGGSKTQQHWDLADEKNKAKQTINMGKVDVLTLSPHLMIPDQGITNFVNLMLEKNPESRVLIQASWMPFDNWEKRIANNTERNDAKIDELRKAYEDWDKRMHDQVAAINKEHQEKSKRPVIFVVPVGQAVMSLRERVVAGKVPGVEKQADLFTDPIGHCRPPVWLLNAYCHFAVIYKQSPVGLPTPNSLKKMEKGDELAQILQEIAWEAVTKDPASGVK